MNSFPGLDITILNQILVWKYNNNIISLHADQFLYIQSFQNVFLFHCKFILPVSLFQLCYLECGYYTYKKLIITVGMSWHGLLLIHATFCFLVLQAVGLHSAE